MWDLALLAAAGLAASRMRNRNRKPTVGLLAGGIGRLFAGVLTFVRGHHCSMLTIRTTATVG